ncbi:MAG: hypothetical protein NC930_00890 [Candidatus Omnitrophica bacterium]|nr:hypothetical protein [Candidatus Omnitrophota bacterium]
MKIKQDKIEKPLLFTDNGFWGRGKEFFWCTILEYTTFVPNKIEKEGFCLGRTFLKSYKGS